MFSFTLKQDAAPHRRGIRDADGEIIGVYEFRAGELTDVDPDHLGQVACAVGHAIFVARRDEKKRVRSDWYATDYLREHGYLPPDQKDDDKPPPRDPPPKPKKRRAESGERRAESKEQRAESGEQRAKKQPSDLPPPPSPLHPTPPSALPTPPSALP